MSDETTAPDPARGDRRTGPVAPGPPSEGAPPPSGAPSPSGEGADPEPVVESSERFAGLGEAIAAAAAEVEADVTEGDAGGDRLVEGDGEESAVPLSAARFDAAGPDEDGGDDDEDAEAAAQQLLDDLDRLQGERNEYLEQLLRTKADFENYRKRVLKQQAEQVERAAEELVEKLIEVLDVYDGAKAHAEGFEQVGSSLVSLLEKEGLIRIDPVGATFDPTESDAVMHEEGDDGPVVSDVLRPGYRWKGRVVRPAMVKVRG